MAKPKARPAREAPQGGSQGEDKPKEKHLVQSSGAFNCILHRDSAYRENARAVLKGTAMYDDTAQITQGVNQQKSVKKAKGAAKAALIKEKVPLYKFGYVNKDFGNVKNFETGSRPYGNQAHHILVCELFYDDRWTEEHLDIIKQTKYNINNSHNIIYLPLSNYSGRYHDLPNHRSGHDKYSNKQLSTHVDPIFDLVDQAKTEAEEDECDPETLKDIYDQLIAIEDEYWKMLADRGAGSMA